MKGKKPPGATQKQRSGLDITRFLERKSARQAPTADGSRPSDAQHVAGIRPPVRRPPTPGKHLLDNVLLSQDMDDGGLQVVWASSPTAAYSSQKGLGVSQEAPSGGVSQPLGDHSQGSRGALLPILQQAAPDRVEEPVPGGEDVQQEQLDARRGSHRGASTSAPSAVAQAGPWAGPRSGTAPARNTDAEDDAFMDRILAATDAYKTPAVKHGGEARPSASTRSGDRSRPALTPAAVTLGAQKRALPASAGNKGTSGNKRRALLDLLDQVEQVVKHRATQAAAPVQPAEELQQMGEEPGDGAGPMDTEPSPGLEERAEGAGGSAGGSAGAQQAQAPGAAGSVPEGTPLAASGPMPPPAARLPSARVSPPVGPGSAAPPGAAPGLLHASLPATCSGSQPVASNLLGQARAAPGANSQGQAGAHAPWQAVSQTQPQAQAWSRPPSTQALHPAAAPAAGLHPQPFASQAAHPHPHHGPVVPAPLGPRPVSPPLEPQVVGPAHKVQGGTQAVVPIADDSDDDWGDDVDIDAIVAAATQAPAKPLAAAAAPAVPPPPPQPARQPLAPCVPPQQLGAPHPSVSTGDALKPLQQQPQPQQPQAQAPPEAQAQAQAQSPPQQQQQQAGGHGAVAEALPSLQEIRHIVREVYEDPTGNSKFLICYHEHTKTQQRVFLYPPWHAVTVKPGDPVNIIGALHNPDARGGPALEISDQQGMFVLHPDILVPSTRLSCATADCVRKAWLGERVEQGFGGAAALQGSLAHELVEWGMRRGMQGSLSSEDFKQQAMSLISHKSAALLEARETVDSVRANLLGQGDTLQRWRSLYVPAAGATPLGGQVYEVGEPAPDGRPSQQQDTRPLFCRVDDVADIEEYVCAPRFGLKGKVDTSLRVTLTRVDPANLPKAQPGPGPPQAQQQPHQAQQHPGAQQQGSNRFHGMAQSQPPPRQQHQNQNQWQQQRRSLSGAEGAAAQARGGLAPPGPQGQGQAARQHSWSVGVVAPAQGQAQGQQGQHAQRNSCASGNQAGQLQPQAPQQQPPLPGGQQVIVPFEYKSGKHKDEFKYQVLSYQLLFHDRYRTPTPTGLLWVSSNSAQMAAVHQSPHLVAQTMAARNRLAAALAGASPQPPPAQPEQPNACQRCYARTTCAVLVAAERSGGGGAAAAGAEGAAEGAGSGQGQVVLNPRSQQQQHQRLAGELEKEVAAVEPSAAAFYAKWARLVDLEQSTALAHAADLWTLSGPEREKRGSCISRLTFLRELPELENEDGSTAFVLLFGRSPGTAAAAQAAAAAPAMEAASRQAEAQEQTAGAKVDVEALKPLDQLGFARGDHGVLSVEGRHVNVANVNILDITKDTVRIACRSKLQVQRLQSDPSPPHPPCSCGACSLAPATALPARACTCGAAAVGSGHPVVTWRFDKTDGPKHYNEMRANLLWLAMPSAAQGDQGGRGGWKKAPTPADLAAAEARRREDARRAKLRRLIVDLQPPLQNAVAAGTQPAGTPAHPSQSQALNSQALAANAYVAEAMARMNPEQLAAVGRVLAMSDYAVLMGMPGSGKTTTVVHIIRALVAANVSVLVAAYTNSAVDNILVRLLAGPRPVEFMRLGSMSRIDPALLPYTPGGDHFPDTSIKSLKEAMARVRVVGVTCLSVRQPLLSGMEFGVCILDEASQATLPVSLGPLALARSFLLVGDHRQLSPLVKNNEAIEGGLRESLFQTLSEKHPQAVVTLRSQYRMAEDVMALSNALIYNGQMRCGSEAVAHARLALPRLPLLAQAQAGDGPSAGAPASGPGAAGSSAGWPAGVPVPAWLLQAMQPEVRVVFLDTEGAEGCRELSMSEGNANPGEVRLISALVAGLVAAGLPAYDIGVMSPYRAQVAALRQALGGLAAAPPPDAAADSAPSSDDADDDPIRDDDGPPLFHSASAPPAATAAAQPAGAEAEGVEVLTVDQYQGREKQAVLVSLVHSNEERKAGKLLGDEQRVNVLLTRAKTKLVLVGSAATLAALPLWSRVVGMLRERGAVVAVPAGAVAELPGLRLGEGAGAGPGEGEG